MSDAAAGRTLRSAERRTAQARKIDQVGVRGPAPLPF
jgi:hypothetical protein